MSKVYDIFSFNNELEMLDIRLNILDDHVDCFVLVEATKTFSGIDKPLNYKNNKHLFEKFNHKIIHYVVEDTPTSFEDDTCDQELLQMALNSDNVTRDHICWLVEFYQKEAIKRALIGLDDDDICFVSDVDEIWNYNNKWYVGDEIYKPMINLCYVDYLNVRTDENWTMFTGPIITKYKNIKNVCLNHLRTQRKMTSIYTYYDNGGWHFNALGGSDKKIEDFKHPIYHSEYMERRKLGSRIDDSEIPKYLKDNRYKYEHLFKND